MVEEDDDAKPSHVTWRDYVNLAKFGTGKIGILVFFVFTIITAVN